MFFLQMFSEAFKLLQLSLFPVAELNSYFVILGIFCLREGRDNIVFIITIFMVYNFLLSLKVVYYMQLFVTEGRSTVELFPNVFHERRNENLDQINPFIVEDIIKKKIDQSQFCNICNTYKPPRAHHCSVCNRCYLKYNHHSSILNICIAFHNYKYFIQFLLTTFISSTLVIFLILFDLTNELNTTRIVRAYQFNLMINIIEFIISVVLLFIHLPLICRNETTLECISINKYLIGDNSYAHIFQEGQMKVFIDSTKREVLNPYNLGLINNWKQVFGNLNVGVLLPTFTSYGDGINWKKNDEEDINYSQGEERMPSGDGNNNITELL